MKKICFVLVAIAMLSGLFIATGEAGQLCWQMDFPSQPDFNGYVSVVASGAKWTRAVHGVWYVQGSTYWPMAGNMIKTVEGIKWYLQLNSTFIGGYLGLIATLDSSTLSGSGKYTAIDADVTTIDVTFTKISCKEMPPYVAP